MMYNYTNTFRLAMELSFQRAKELHAVEVTPDLLIYGIIKQGSNPCMDYLRQHGLNIEQLLQDYDDYIEDTTPRVAEEHTPTLGESSKQVIAEAVKRCTEEEPAITPMHLLQTIIDSNEDTYLKRTLVDKIILDAPSGSIAMGIQSFTETLARLLGLSRTLSSMEGQDEDEDEEEDEEEEKLQGQHGRSGSPKKGGKERSGGNKTPMLNQFGRDITALAREGALDPVVGRDKEIERMTQVLGRRRKSNPILIGEPGVGKTTLVEGLAQRIVENNVPTHLIGKRVIELDLSGIVAGTKYRGQFEERIKDILEELEQSPDVIIYIDEIHTMVGAGGGSGSMDAANMLKPALARGGVQCIGATTLEEYRKHIEQDGALERRFQKIIVEPSTAEETLAILKQLRDRYEVHHEVVFTDEALEAMVILADRYINDRNFPDKAIDLIDETGSRKGNRFINAEMLSPVLELERERTLCIQKKLEAIDEQQFELAASYRNAEKELDLAIEEARASLLNEKKANRIEVRAEDVSEVVAMMTGIPVQTISGTELERLRTLEANLKARIIGQDEAVEKIARSIKRSRLGLRDGKRPIGSFLFLGPTGVGKTHLVKCLGEELFGLKDSLIRVDMSEFMEKFSVSRLVGAPPGYVGYDQGGQLTERVRRRPYSIVLFDEIEKAHPDVFNLLLQILDEGCLTDSYGRRVDFRNTIIVITSNVGSRQAKDFGRGIGFQEEENTGTKSADIMRKALNKAFSPEFLNRLDEIIQFSNLDKPALRRIISVELEPLEKRLNEAGYRLELDEAAIELLTQIAYHPEYGARPLRRALQREIEDRLTDLILEGAIKQGDCLSLTAQDGKISLKTT